MSEALDPKHPHLGGNVKYGDVHSWVPELWTHLRDYFAVGSMLDVGCGEGHVVAFFHRLGVHAHGIDGLQANVQRAVISIAQHDILIRPYIMPVDFVWSCEVAEHIDKCGIDHYIQTLSNGQVVAMTHAVPGQPGYHHVNCQPAEYWIDLMASRGYELHCANDLFREIAAKSATWNYFQKTGLVFLRKY